MHKKLARAFTDAAKVAEFTPSQLDSMNALIEEQHGTCFPAAAAVQSALDAQICSIVSAKKVQ